MASIFAIPATARQLRELAMCGKILEKNEEFDPLARPMARWVAWAIS